MAKQAMTGDPTKITKDGTGKDTSASIDVDTWYTIQNRSGLDAFIQTSDTKPSASGDGAFVISPREVTQVKRTHSTDEVYVWQTDSSGQNRYGLLIFDLAD